MHELLYKDVCMSERGDVGRGDIDAYAAVAALFDAMSTPLRAALVHRLCAGEQTVGDLVEWTGRSQPLVSQHLRILRTARLVSGERRGREVVYSLTDEHVAHVLLDAFQHTQENHP
jgi:ArsR family transcriptional regulator, zinc-responsive transcriptional repressor